MRDPGDEATTPLPSERQIITNSSKTPFVSSERMDNSYKCTSKSGPPLHSDDIAIPLAGTTTTPMSLNNVFIRISNDPKTKIDTQSNGESDNLLSSL